MRSRCVSRKMLGSDWRWSVPLTLALAYLHLTTAFQPSDHYSIAHTAFTQYHLPLSPISKLHIVDALLQEDAELPGQYHPEWHWDNEAIYNASSSLLALKSEISTALQPSSPNAPLFETQCLLARQMVGWGMHTIHDFYSHTTYTALPNATDISYVLGRSTYPDPPADTIWCTGSNQATLNATAVSLNSQTVTSGYLPWQFDDLCSAPTGKCFHGSRGTQCANGIAIEDPSNGNYTTAYNLAVKATVDWLQQVEAMLNVTNTDGLQCLYSAQDYDQLAIVLDGTAPTAAYVQRLRAALTQQQQLFGSDTAPVSYLLQTFNTTSAVDTMLTRVYSELLSTLNGLQFTGQPLVTSQTQCGAAVLEGILEAVTNAEIDTLMTVITSCAPTDVQYLSPVIHTAIDKDIVISVVAIGDCVQQDPHLPFLVQQLGGYYYATDIQDTAFNTYMVQATSVLPVNYTVLAAYDFNTSSNHVALTWETSTIQQVAVATYNATNSSMDGTTFIAQNNGQLTYSAGPEVSATIQNSTQSNEQTLTIDTTAPVGVAVYAQSTVVLETCELYQVDGRISHYGWLPSSSLPVINSASSIALRATLFGDPVTDVTIGIIDVASGTVTAQLSALPFYNQSAVSSGIQQYVATITPVPTSPFRCQVNATHNNITLSRVNIIPFQPQTVNVTAVSAMASMPLDTTSTVAFLVQNTASTAETFSLAGYTEPYFGNSSTRVNGVMNDTLYLAAGKSQIVTVDVLVPSTSSSVNSTVVTRLSVTGTSGVHTGNFQANYMSMLVSTQACPWGAACGKGHFQCNYTSVTNADNTAGTCGCTDLYTGSDCTIARYATPTSTPSPTSAPASSTSSSKDLSGGAIAGAVIGSLVGVAAIGAAAFFLYKYYDKRRSTGTYGRQFDDGGVSLTPPRYSSDAI